MIENFRPDALVSDIGMPNEDGYALIRQLRTREIGTGRQAPRRRPHRIGPCRRPMKALSPATTCTSLNPLSQPNFYL